MEKSFNFRHYQILSLLGEGGMAKVYLAEDLRFHSRVAIKILNPELVANKNIRNRFLGEARSMFRMNHPNVIRVTDLIEETDEVAFVMEYVEGITLRDKIVTEGPLDKASIRNISCQILDALAYVHRQNLVHRDIKPSNFLINNDGVVKLLDFGIAKITDSNFAEYTQTSTAQHLGTPLYMSPEQVISTKEVTPASDIYSFGVVLWQMVTGRRPYNTDTTSAFEIQTLIVNQPLELTHTFFDTIIAKCTAKDPGSRFSSAVDCRNAIHAELTESGEFRHNTRVGNDATHEDRTVLWTTGQDPVNKISKTGQSTVPKIVFWIAGTLVLGIVVFVLLKRKNDDKASIKESAKNTLELSELKSDPIKHSDTTARPVEVGAASDPVPDPADENQAATSSFLDTYGKLVYRDPCYVIVAGAWLYELDARKHVRELQENGYTNAGYLWIPDYPSLSGKQNYATFIGPYSTKEACLEMLQYLPSGQKFWYAKKVSMEYMTQDEIRY